MASRFSSIIYLVSSCASMAWQELVYSEGNSEDRESLYSKALNLYFIFIMLATTIILPVISMGFNIIFSKDYLKAYPYVPLNMFATGLSIISGFLGNIYGAEKRTSLLMISTVAGAITNMVFVQTFLLAYGLQVANISLCLGFLITILLRIILLKIKRPTKDDIKIFFILVLFFLCGLYFYYLRNFMYNSIFLIVAVIFSSVILDKYLNLYKLIRQLLKHDKRG